MHFFKIYYNKHHLNVSNSSTFIVLAASQRGCTINAIDCMYNKLASEDE